MKSIHLYKKLILLLCAVMVCFTAAACSGDPQKPTAVFSPDFSTVGVWWWDDSLGTEYLDFAANSGVDEIYYCTGDFSDKTRRFIRAASDRNIKVFLLAGEYQWIYDNTGLERLMSKYRNYQAAAEQNAHFSGVHLDVEPHQDPGFSADRSQILNAYLNFVTEACAAHGPLDFDIPFWLSDPVQYGGAEIPLYQAVIAEASRVFVMSYRDTASAMYNAAQEELAYAKSLNKPIVLGAETYSAEGDNVSFAEEGKEYMYQEINKLPALAGYAKCGVCIHQIKTWFDLKD